MKKVKTEKLGVHSTLATDLGIVKIDKWDGSAVKNALDDAVRKVLTEKFHYIENHSLMDGRLIICGLAVGIAMFALLWDYVYPFPQSRTVLILCVLSYFLLMGVLTLYTTFKEKGIFLVAVKKDQAGIDPDQIWNISSLMKRFDDKYQLVMSFNSSVKRVPREAKFEKSVANWFDQNGVLVYDIFESEVSKLHNSLLVDKKDK